GGDTTLGSHTSDNGMRVSRRRPSLRQLSDAVTPRSVTLSCVMHPEAALVRPFTKRARPARIESRSRRGGSPPARPAPGAAGRLERTAASRQSSREVEEVAFMAKAAEQTSFTKDVQGRYLCNDIKEVNAWQGAGGRP